jgi:RNA polymerase sigma-70 factor (ECF subfamily)
MPDLLPSDAADGDEDAALLARWRGGDERAATLLVERHAGAVARYVASLGARDEAEEIVQDTFVRAFASLERFRRESSLRTWLLTIARNLVVDRARKRRARGRAVPVSEEHAATGHDALDELVAGETGARMRSAVARLTPMQREVFTLRVGEGLSYREIAALAGTTEGAARVHYFNAMRAIREYLDD